MGQIISSLLTTVISGASGGLVTLLIFLIKRRDEKKKERENCVTKDEFTSYMEKLTKKMDLTNEMCMGLAHDRIMFLGEKYIEAGEISIQTLEDFNKYLYEPYQAMGGNGSGESIWKQVNNLPIKGGNK